MGVKMMCAVCVGLSYARHGILYLLDILDVYALEVLWDRILRNNMAEVGSLGSCCARCGFFVPGCQVFETF